MRSVRLVHNADYRNGGMASSIKTGLEAVSAGSRATLIALVDQPRVSPAAINLVIEAYRRERRPIVIPTFAGKKGHPALIDMKLQSRILTLPPEKGLNHILRAHIDETQLVEVDDESILDDFDFPEDYDRLGRGRV
jgi:CTP:molybdopterin cytidylyltransferase MocA